MTLNAWSPVIRGRSFYPVHPCADVYPMMSDTEIDALAADINANGLQHPVEVSRDESTTSRWVVFDGRNRLAALERAGIEIPCDPDQSSSWRNGTRIFKKIPYPVDPAAYVISANIRRRHLTKEQQAELIVKTIDAGRAKLDRAKVARSIGSTPGQKGGSTKDPVLAKAVTEAAKHGISKRTVQNARAKLNGKTPAKTPTSTARPSVRHPIEKPSGPPSVMGPKLDIPTFLAKVKPIVDALFAEGRKNMATMSPPTVGHLTFKLAGYLDRLTRDTTPADRHDGFSEP